jgi:glycosyltransferase involved in cell wall biosynthesis
MSGTCHISIVSPVYKAEKIVPELVRRIIETVSGITDDYEIVLIEDCGPDNSWAAIEAECTKNPKVKGLKFSRNFGQHYAITAGFTYSKGEYVVVMDCDLQDNPQYIIEMYNKAREGNDIVQTYKKSRKHSFLKNITAVMFYKVFNYLIDNKNYDANKNEGSYSLLSRKAVEAYLSVTEYHRHYLMILRMLGFRKAYIEIEHDKRFEGKSSYSWSKLIAHAITGITSQSDKLLRLSMSLGFTMFLISLTWALVLIYKYFTTGLLSGYASIMIFQLLGTGIILISIGTAGIYIGKIFEQVKNRPLFIIDKSANIN